eukprot:87561_1
MNENCNQRITVHQITTNLRSLCSSLLSISIFGNFSLIPMSFQKSIICLISVYIILSFGLSFPQFLFPRVISTKYINTLIPFLPSFHPTLYTANHDKSCANSVLIHLKLRYIASASHAPSGFIAGSCAQTSNCLIIME